MYAAGLHQLKRSVSVGKGLCSRNVLIYLTFWYVSILLKKLTRLLQHICLVCIYCVGMHVRTYVCMYVVQGSTYVFICALPLTVVLLVVL